MSILYGNMIKEEDFVSELQLVPQERDVGLTEVLSGPIRMIEFVRMRNGGDI